MGRLPAGAFGRGRVCGGSAGGGAGVVLRRALCGSECPCAIAVGRSRHAADLWFRTAALHFQIRDAMGNKERDKTKTYNACLPCHEHFELFMRELKSGQDLARATLKQNPGDATALYFLGKLDLNYVWLVLGTLGRRTGWNEFWRPATRSMRSSPLDPAHLRGRVARAWIEYIVDTRMPWGTAWMLGGGNKRKALAAMQEAAASQGEYYSRRKPCSGCGTCRFARAPFLRRSSPRVVWPPNFPPTAAWPISSTARAQNQRQNAART